jgi:hypothetical protein
MHKFGATELAKEIGLQEIFAGQIVCACSCSDFQRAS